MIPHIPESKYHPMQQTVCQEWREFCAERVGRHFNRFVGEAQLHARMGRFGEYPTYRFYAMALMEAHGLSQPRIAAVLGLSDHTSVLHGLRRAHGHDGKLEGQYEPLWKREHFEKIALADTLVNEANGIGRAA